jgi:cell division protein FtsW
VPPRRPEVRTDPPTTRVRDQLRTGPARVSRWMGRPLASLHLLLAVFGLLTLLGLAMVLSASSVTSIAKTGSPYGVFWRQVLFCVAGLVTFWIGLRVPPRNLRAMAPTVLVVTLVLLVAVLVPGVGTTIAGARKWFTVAGLSFQPSEPAKVALALWGAHVLATRRRSVHLWQVALVPLVPVSMVMLLLVVLEPDLGTAISIAVLVGALLFYGRAPARLLLLLGGGGVGAVVVLALTAGYRQARIAAFLSPDTTDSLGAGYQSKQALYALADGGFFGLGLGQGRAKWDYLPNGYNDFIFAILGEELGMIGGIVVLALFALLAWTGARIAARNTDPWLKIITAALTTWLVAQAAINIGYVIGLLPVTGIPLPLISSGGTSLVVTMFAFGLLASAARHEPEAIATLQQKGPGRTARLLRLPTPTSTSTSTSSSTPRPPGRAHPSAVRTSGTGGPARRPTAPPPRPTRPTPGERAPTAAPRTPRPRAQPGPRARRGGTR